MNLIYTLLIFLAGYSLLKWVIIPSYQVKTENTKDKNVFTRLQITNAILELFKNFCFYAVVAFTLFIIFWLSAAAVNESSSNEVVLSALRRLNLVSGFLKSFSFGWSVFVFILVLIALIRSSSSRIKGKYEKATSELFEKKYQEQKVKFENKGSTLWWIDWCDSILIKGLQ